MKENVVYTEGSVSFIINHDKLVVVDMVLGTSKTVDLRPLGEILGIPRYDESVFDNQDPYTLFEELEEHIQELVKDLHIPTHLSSGTIISILRFILKGSVYETSDSNALDGKRVKVWSGV